MASFYCESCGVDWPHNMKFQVCPECGDGCSRVKNDPTMSKEEAYRRLNRAHALEEFERWCEENGRRPANAPAPTIIMPDREDKDAVRLALNVATMIEDVYPWYALGKLEVFWPPVEE